MAKAYTLILGIILGAHALVGFFVEGQHLLNVMNTDLPVDILYLLCALALLTVTFTRSSPGVIRGTVWVVALLLLALAIAGLINRTVWGVLPTGLTAVDLALLFIAGGLGLVVALLHRSPEPLTTAGKPIN